jgi:HNH endonuclease
MKDTRLELFRVCADTGRIVRKVTLSHNAREGDPVYVYAGELAVSGKRVSAVRAAWLLQTGEWPTKAVWFKGPKGDYRLENLELAFRKPPRPKEPKPPQPRRESQSYRTIPIEVIQRMFHYDEDTGVVTKLTQGVRGSGGTGCLHSKGYLRFKVGDKAVRAHNIAWALKYAQWPDKEIDHWNGNRADNRWKNLREAESGQNKWNSKARKSASGVKGVRREPSGTWTVQVMKDGKRHRQSGIATLEEAIRIVRELRESLHGEFANHG